MQMQWLALAMCLYTGIVSARIDDDQQQSSTSGVSLQSSSLTEQCFYRSQTDCPNVDGGPNKCPCKKITLTNMPESIGALCCNVDKETLDYGLSCIGEYYCKNVYATDCSINFQFFVAKFSSNCDQVLLLSSYSRIQTFIHKPCCITHT